MNIDEMVNDFGEALNSKNTKSKNKRLHLNPQHEITHNTYNCNDFPHNYKNYIDFINNYLYDVYKLSETL